VICALSRTARGGSNEKENQFGFSSLRALGDTAAAILCHLSPVRKYHK